MNKTDFLHIHPEVADAIKNNQPIVALESTIISHGMPYPRNVETAISVEAAVRAEGAIPATIAIKEGKCYVGLTNDDLQFFVGRRVNACSGLIDEQYFRALQNGACHTKQLTLTSTHIRAIL